MDSPSFDCRPCWHEDAKNGLMKRERVPFRHRRTLICWAQSMLTFLLLITIISNRVADLKACKAVLYLGTDQGSGRNWTRLHFVHSDLRGTSSKLLQERLSELDEPDDSVVHHLTSVNPREPDLDVASDARPNHMKIVPEARSNVEATSEARSAVGATSGARSALGATSEARSVVGATSEARSAMEATSEARPAVETTRDASSAVGATSEARPAVEATSEARSAMEATSEARPSVETTSDASSAVEATSEARSALEATSEARPALDQDKTEARRNHLPTFNQSCNLYWGKWVKDKKGYPLYDGSECPILEPAFNCKKFGRASLKFAHYRWQPYECELPQFDSQAVLEAFRDKRVLFVGDSMMRQMFQSLMCMLWKGPGSHDDTTRPVEVRGRRPGRGVVELEYRFDGFNATFLWLWSTHLMHTDAREKTWVNLDKVGDWSRAGPARALVLSTGPWWSPFIMHAYKYGLYGCREKTATIASSSDRSSGEQAGEDGDCEAEPPREGSKKGGARQYKPVGGFVRATNKLNSFLTSSPTLRDTHVTMLGVPPVHFFEGPGASTYFNDDAEDWRLTGSCHWVERPLKKKEWPQRRLKTRYLERLFGNSSSKVEYIDTWRVSAGRADAHVGMIPIFPRDKAGKILDEAHPMSWRHDAQDCRHFCLPGVPDVWNELLVATWARQGLVTLPLAAPSPPPA